MILVLPFDKYVYLLYLKISFYKLLYFSQECWLLLLIPKKFTNGIFIKIFFVVSI